MKKHCIHKRITALLLLVSVLVGLLPSVYSLPAQAATAADLIAQIDGLEELIPTNKRVPTIEYSTINDTNRGNAWTAYSNLGGKTYIIVNTLREYSGITYYYPEGYFAAMNPMATSASGEIAATRVQPVALSAGGYALLGADPAWGLKLTVNTSGNNIVNPTGGTSYTLRMNCSLYHTASGKYLKFDYTTGAITLSSSADTNMVIYGSFKSSASPYCDFRDMNGSTAYRMYLEGYKDPDHPVYKLCSSNLTVNPAGRARVDLYEVLTNRANTEPIYNAIVRGGQALKDGLGTDNTAFLAALETAIACYNNYNGEDVTGTAKTNAEAELAAALAALTPYVDHKADIEALPLPQNVLVTGENNIDNMEGAAYYILTKEADGKTGHLLNINLEPTNGYAHAEDVEIYSYSVSEDNFVTSNTYVTNADPSMAIKVMEAENTTALTWTSTLRSVRGSTISYAAKEGTTDGTQVFAAGNRTTKLHSYDTSAGQQRMMVYGSGAAYRCYVRYNDTVDGFEYVLSQVTADSATYSKAPTGVEWYFYFYKMAVQVAELYRAIDRMKIYADGNADGQYAPEVYAEFIQCLEDAMEKYQLHCYLSAESVLADEDEETVTVTEELNKLADDLLAYRSLLTAADTQAEYIDIPVEILDFRADGMLFEYYNSEFGLVSSNGTDDANMGGKYDNVIGTRTGQTLQTLTGDRELIYTKETVNYVAHTLNDNKNQTEEAELNHFKNLPIRAPGWNDNLWNMLRQKDLRLGSWEDTLEDTDSGENGGVLPLANIDSCFDMAYYILNGLWRKVDQEKDILADGVSYNMPVPERDRVRLYLDEETGLYKLESNKDVVTFDYYAANAIPLVDNIDPYAGPFFQPINNLGFEEPTLMESLGGDTDAGKHHYKNRTFNCEEMNFHYTLHAYGSFIYYRDRNLRFEFVGDDDVYFFINNKMAMDIGGGHNALGATLYLNDKAEELGLVDGGIYTFDMFYAERHTTASNLNFNTNIIIVDTETITAMGQYLVESANVSQVDSTTGLGAELNENALVNVGDTVAYSFDLLNVRDVPIYNISFTDKNLGTDISPAGITLYSPDKTNGAQTKITDISVYYRTYADDTVDSSIPKVMTYSDMEDMLTEACEEPVNDVFSSLAPGSYVVRIETVDQLQKLLTIGIPIDCQMSVYGVKRITVEGDTPFSNTVISLAHYKRVGDFTEEAEEFSVSGVATRSLQVAGAVPEATPQRFVLDYGKPLAIDLDAIRKSIRTDRSVTVTSFAGLSTAGQNSQLLVYKPNLSCTKEAEPYTTENGTYTLSGNQLVFQMSDFMDSTDRVYAAFELNGCVVVSGGVRTEYRYILVELVLVPATSVYYEAEDFTDVIDTESVDSSLFFDFTNDPRAQERYESPIYGGINFDKGYWKANTARNTNPSLSDADVGTLSTTNTGNRDFYFQQTNSLGTLQALPMNFKPAGAEILQMRLRFNDFTHTGDTNCRIALQYLPDKYPGETTVTSPPVAAEYYITEEDLSGDYITVEVDLSDEFKTRGAIHALRLTFWKFSLNGTVTVDYIYVGPKSGAPMQEHLYFDFTDLPSDRYRYESSVYGDNNYDTGNWGHGAESNTKPVFDPEAGTLSTTSTKVKNYVYIHTSNSSGSTSAAPLSFDPGRAEVALIRLKLEGFTYKEGNALYLEYFHNGEVVTSLPDAGKHVLTKEDLNGEYFTARMELSQDFIDSDVINALRISMMALSQDTVGTMTVDSIFVGTEADAAKVEAVYKQYWMTVGEESTHPYQDMDISSVVADAPANTLLEDINADGPGTGYPLSSSNVQNAVAKLGTDQPFSITHRGAWRRTSANSLLAVYDSIMYGMDAAEIDIQVTKDNIPVLCHDANIRNATTATAQTTVASLTYAQLKDYPLVSGSENNYHNTTYSLTAADVNILKSLSHYTSNYGTPAVGNPLYMPSLESVCDLLKAYGPNTMLTLDKMDTKNNFAYSYKVVREKGLLDNVIFKFGAGGAAKNTTNLDAWLSAAATAAGVTASEVKSTAMLMYVSGYSMNTATLNDYLTKGYGFVGVEYTYGADKMPNAETELIGTVAPFCKSKGLMLSGSTISGTAYRHYCGGRPEEETTWAALYNMGCTAIMTDAPQEMGAFLQTYDAGRNVIRQSADTIQAEAFSEYNYDAENLRCNQALDSNGNKLVLGMSEEDYLVYDNIKFTGTEDTLYFRAQGLHRSATLRFYIDSLESENCIASAALPRADDCVSMTAALVGSIPAGTHRVYVMALGAEEAELANFDSFSFAPEDHYLLFDFDNSQESQERYELDIYGGLDFDNVESWYTNDTNLTISDGAITLTDSPTNGSSYSYFVTGVGDQDDNPLHYTAGINDYCQIRFRIDNGAAVADDTAKIILCFGIDGSKVIGNDDVPGTSLNLDLGEVGDKGYVTKTFPLADNFTGNITSICAFFKNMVSGDTRMTISIDYLYIGPIEQEDSLYFTFENTEADRLRYEGAAYGGGKFNFDAPGDHVAGAWATYGNTANASGSATRNDFTVNNTEGTATIYVQNGTNGESVYGPKLMTTATPGYYPYGADNGKRAPLLYDASGAEYAQVRFRIDDCESVDASGNATAPVLQMEFRFNDTSGGSSILYDAFKTNYTLSDGKWMTVTMPLTGAFTAAEAVTTIGVRFLNLRSKEADTRGTVKIDYIFVGPKEDLPTNQNLLFDFTNTAADRARYSSTTYGYYNFDQEGEGYWATHGTAQLDASADKGYVQRYNKIAVDNTAGVAEVAVTFSKGDESQYGPKVMTTNTYNVYPWRGRATYAPLSYYPENSEFMQVRFKLEGCTTDKEGTIPWVEMEYHYHDPSTNLDNIKYEDKGTTEQTYTILEGEWITLTLPLSATFRNAMKITSLGLRFRGLKAKSESADGVLTIDYIYVGTREALPSAYAPVYGYDSGYDGDETLSDNRSLYVEGNGVKVNASTKKYTEASFSFVGTGFDLISRTGAQQATIRVSIYTDKARTKLHKAITVQNKGELELYQIPVVSVRDLSYGTYYVTVGVNAAITNSAYPVLNRGGQFFFDALRIYEPLELSKEDNREALELYREHKEAYPYVQEVRNILLTATEFEAVAGTTSGGVFIDAGRDNNGSYTTPVVKTYESLGPKNETYLAQNQAVAFKLVLNTEEIPMSIDIGAKSITGETPTLLVGYGGKKGSGSTPAAVAQSMTTLTQVLKTSTGMYYPLSVQADHFTTGSDGLKYMYIVLCNQGEDVLSVTDIKVAYERIPTYLTAATDELTAAPETPSEKRSYAVAGAQEVFPISCMVDGETFEVAKRFLAEGELPPAEPVDETVGIYHTLNLASDIAVSFLVPEAHLRAYDSFYMECTVPLYKGTQQEGSRVVTLYPTLKSGYYYFTLTGLTAVNMSDTIEAVVHMTADGTAYVSNRDTYSIATYAYSQLDRASTGDSLKALCAQLLRYGAAAQTYKGYRTDALADAAMTDIHRAYLTDLDGVSFGNTNSILGDLPEPSVTWAGKTLNLESRVAVKFVFYTTDYTGDPEELTLHISYTGLDGEQITATVENPEPYGSDGRRYTFSYDGLSAAELRTVLSAQIYRGETPVSPTLQYSPDTYGKGKTGTLGDLCKALFAYSDSAKTYFLG